MKSKSAPKMLTLVDREPYRDSKHERFHVAATVTQEKPWSTAEPNQGLARMFVIMLLVHVVVIGGVIVYDFVAEPADVVQSAANRSAQQATKAPVPAARAAAPLPTVQTEPAPATVTTPAPVVPSSPVAPPAPVASPASLLPVGAAVITSDPPKALPVTLPPAGVPAQPVPVLKENPLPAPTAIAPLPVKKATVVDLPPAPNPTKEVVPPPAPVVKQDPPKPVKREEQAKREDKPKAAAPAEARRATPIANEDLKPVPTPSAARRDLSNDNRKPTTQKKAADSPPTTKRSVAVENKKSGSNETKKAKTGASKGSGGKHVVAKGETVYSIARKFKVSEDAIIKANGIKNANALQIGKSLVIP